ncbi:hypothetical protein PsYK624_168420 [Phanerochaete sordida]|uniref:Uncharacterized protein n=1 Tax=Phanerochaete sordida TaxID=48140 RepID=A0A9P3GRK3_9APHY|nr:hypothetical protein PsYK624_168420 [Phanerochaete sordida]
MSSVVPKGRALTDHSTVRLLIKAHPSVFQPLVGENNGELTMDSHCTRLIDSLSRLPIAQAVMSIKKGDPKSDEEDTFIVFLFCNDASLKRGDSATAFDANGNPAAIEFNADNATVTLINLKCPRNSIVSKCTYTAKLLTGCVPCKAFMSSDKLWPYIPASEEMMCRMVMNEDLFGKVPRRLREAVRLTLARLRGTADRDDRFSLAQILEARDHPRALKFPKPTDACDPHQEYRAHIAMYEIFCRDFVGSDFGGETMGDDGEAMSDEDEEMEDESARGWDSDWSEIPSSDEEEAMDDGGRSAGDALTDEEIRHVAEPGVRAMEAEAKAHVEGRRCHAEACERSTGRLPEPSSVGVLGLSLPPVSVHTATVDPRPRPLPATVDPRIKNPQTAVDTDHAVAQKRVASPTWDKQEKGEKVERKEYTRADESTSLHGPVNGMSLARILAPVDVPIPAIAVLERESVREPAVCYHAGAYEEQVRLEAMPYDNPMAYEVLTKTVVSDATHDITTLPPSEFNRRFMAKVEDLDQGPAKSVMLEYPVRLAQLTNAFADGLTHCQPSPSIASTHDSMPGLVPVPSLENTPPPVTVNDPAINLHTVSELASQQREQLEKTRELNERILRGPLTRELIREHHENNKHQPIEHLTPLEKVQRIQIDLQCIDFITRHVPPCAAPLMHQTPGAAGRHIASNAGAGSVLSNALNPRRLKAVGLSGACRHLRHALG